MIAVSLFTRFCAVFFAAVEAVVLPKIGPWKGFAYGTLIFSFNYAMFVLPPGQSGAYLQPLIKVAGEAFTARLTIDITPELRGRIKVAAFRRGITVTDMLRDLLAREFPSIEGDPT